MPEAIFRPDRLKASREDKCLSLSELAKKAGVSRNDIANAEAGRVKKPRYWFMIRVAKALEQHPEYFFDSVIVNSQSEEAPDASPAA